MNSLEQYNSVEISGESLELQLLEMSDLAKGGEIGQGYTAVN